MKASDSIITHIASECSEFEHVIHAMGYGYSLLNVSEQNYIIRCDYCINWEAGTCSILQSELLASRHS